MEFCQYEFSYHNSIMLSIHESFLVAIEKPQHRTTFHFEVFPYQICLFLFYMFSVYIYIYIIVKGLFSLSYFYFAQTEPIPSLSCIKELILKAIQCLKRFCDFIQDIGCRHRFIQHRK